MLIFFFFSSTTSQRVGQGAFWAGHVAVRTLFFVLNGKVATYLEKESEKETFQILFGFHFDGPEGVSQEQPSAVGARDCGAWTNEEGSSPAESVSSCSSFGMKRCRSHSPREHRLQGEGTWTLRAPQLHKLTIPTLLSAENRPSIHLYTYGHQRYSIIKCFCNSIAMWVSKLTNR